MPSTDYIPDVDQVAAQTMSRTRNSVGVVTGRFSEDTMPKDSQVAVIIANVINQVADVIGDDIPENLFDDASEVVALRAAMQIELDFFPETVNSGRSIYPQLKDQYNTALANLQKQIVLSAEGERTVVDAGASTQPQFGFVIPEGLMDKRM